jgi:hypothetical protein
MCLISITTNIAAEIPAKAERIAVASTNVTMTAP